MMIVDISNEARLPTEYGEFRIRVFADDEGKEHVALLRGKISGESDVPVRIHSECATGDIFHSLKCDCWNQLDKSLKYVQNEDHGIIIYLKQEGRGIGLLNKINAYKLQEMGRDTIEANNELGFPDDLRGYELAADILRQLHVDSVRLMTNNLEKIEGLKSNGIKVAGRIPLITKPTKYNKNYLKTKKDKMSHLI
ncbi:GTP cyclohydrolase II [Candidatus Altiarchaeota archaeon]